MMSLVPKYVFRCFCLFLLIFSVAIPSVYLYCPEVDRIYPGTAAIRDEDSVILPKDKLPWPHQEPGLSQSEFNALVNELWILDNFGTYHATDDGKYLYFHDYFELYGMKNIVIAPAEDVLEGRTDNQTYPLILIATNNWEVKAIESSLPAEEWAVFKRGEAVAKIFNYHPR